MTSLSVSPDYFLCSLPACPAGLHRHDCRVMGREEWVGRREWVGREKIPSSSVWGILCVVFLLFHVGCATVVPITYGSAICLQHQPSGYKLFSAKISWGSGSGQQAVTGIPGNEYDESVMWYVKEADDSEGAFPAGTPVKCGDLIRLEHAQSGKNLHSHSVRSPISGQNEVSGFGEGGEGNDGDDFTLDCLNKSEEVWYIKSPISLRHRGTGGHLKASLHTRFNRENCPRCPIDGHLEVVVSQKLYGSPTPEEMWISNEGGMLLSLADIDDEDETDENNEHDEL